MERILLDDSTSENAYGLPGGRRRSHPESTIKFTVLGIYRGKAGHGFQKTLICVYDHSLPAMGQHNVYSWYIFQKSDAISTNKTNGDIIVLVP